MRILYRDDSIRGIGGSRRPNQSLPIGDGNQQIKGFETVKQNLGTDTSTKMSKMTSMNQDIQMKNSPQYVTQKIMESSRSIRGSMKEYIKTSQDPNYKKINPADFNNKVTPHLAEFSETLSAVQKGLKMNPTAEPKNILKMGAEKVINFLSQGENSMKQIEQRMTNSQKDHLSISDMMDVSSKMIKGQTSISLAVSSTKQLIDTVKGLMNTAI